MKVLVSIDDTDTMKTEGVEVRGTGELASMLARKIEEYGWGTCQPVTRHQLLIHPDIPYTSHNSSMCFTAEIREASLDELTGYACDFLARESAPGSDPGLCIAVADRLTRPGWLIAFGYMAKNCVITKEEAYDLAAELGIHLSEHGGTGQGVIGALAGAGLRLSGNDGRFRGKLKIRSKNNVVRVRDIYHQSYVNTVKSLEGGAILEQEELVVLGDTVKAVLLDGKPVLLVVPTGERDPGEPRWQTCSKNQLKDY